MSSSELTTRRTALTVAALVATAALALGLAACGGGGGIEGNGEEKKAEQVKYEPPPSGELTISNWPLYIDERTVGNFEKESGVSVKYIEDVNDNAEFFGKMSPLLNQGESGGRSVFVVTDWMANKMHELGYLQDFDEAGLPNFGKNLRAELKSPSYDPERAYSAPWQSGMTGLTVRTDLAPDVHSICDLFDPRYKGKVDMLTEMRDTVPLVMKCMGSDPEGAEEDEWLAAIDKIQGAVESGQIRRFTGNDYARDLTSGDAVAVIGWSGDAVQLQADNPDIEWRMPTEGCILWSDNMVIPVGAPNPTAAEAWIDYVYEPEVQADIAEYVNYVTPVEGVKEILAKREPELARNQLIFPDESFTKKCTIQPTPTGEEEQKITAAFEAVLNG
jgi:spermidine/putrescine transport system substrate-binding protein